MQRKISFYISLFVVAAGFFLPGCKSKNNPEGKIEIAVTNSYLQCIVKDLYGDERDVFCLAPPGMCPGHFDISPSQVNQLSNCRILLLFDFQEKVESSLAGLKERGLKTSLIKSLPGMCIPDVYLATCRDVCSVLSVEFPEKKNIFEQRLDFIAKRIKKLGDYLCAEINKADLSSVKVLASGHQSDFVNWLGLETVATFSGSDAETAFNINECINKAKEQEVKFIIANKQEGTYLADSLADRLDIQTVVFGNFPESAMGITGFDELLWKNVQNLIEATQR
jgi:ABC-type Zn uptake system ZnuABC Zn-binding protein ZnuA